MEPSLTEPIQCPHCEELVQPIVTDDRGHRCPLCEDSLNEVLDLPASPPADSSRDELI